MDLLSWWALVSPLSLLSTTFHVLDDLDRVEELQETVGHPAVPFAVVDPTRSSRLIPRRRTRPWLVPAMVVRRILDGARDALAALAKLAVVGESLPLGLM